MRISSIRKTEILFADAGARWKAVALKKDRSDFLQFVEDMAVPAMSLLSRGVVGNGIV